MIKELNGMFVVTMSHINPSDGVKESTGVKLKNIPDILIVASKKKSDANVQKRLIMKKYKLKVDGKSIINSTDMLELTTNY